MPPILLHSLKRFTNQKLHIESITKRSVSYNPYRLRSVFASSQKSILNFIYSSENFRRLRAHTTNKKVTFALDKSANINFPAGRFCAFCVYNFLITSRGMSESEERTDDEKNWDLCTEENGKSFKK